MNSTGKGIKNSSKTMKNSIRLIGNMYLHPSYIGQSNTTIREANQKNAAKSQIINGEEQCSGRGN